MLALTKLEVSATDTMARGNQPTPKLAIAAHSLWHDGPCRSEMVRLCLYRDELLTLILPWAWPVWQIVIDRDQLCLFPAGGGVI